MSRVIPKPLKRIQIVIWIAVALGAFYWYAHGRGWRHWLIGQVWTFHPWVTGTRPENGEGGILPENFVAVDVMLPNLASGVDGNTLTADSVKLYRSGDHREVEAKRNTTGSGDAIVLQPIQPLELNTNYTFEVTAKVKDTRGAAFRPYMMSFTTARDVKYATFPAAFEQVALPTAKGRFTSLAVGPDHKLYAATFDLGILRFPIHADGTLGEPETIDTVAKANGESRLIVGLCFDPAATADNLILWITNSPTSFSGAPDWTSKVARLCGPALQYYQDIVVGLPRAVKDHVTMQMDFGPDGALYFSQGSNTGMGAPDRKWGFRAERLLSGSILRLDPKLVLNPPLNVKTEEGGSYDPFAGGAPLTIYATGVRVGYRVLWHSNGHCYVGINGSAAHGNTPPTPENFRDLRRVDQSSRGPYIGPAVPPIWDVQQTQPDFLVKVEQGAYYGHPNPLRGEFVQNGGNPTAAPDPVECPEYPVGTLPDRNWRPPTLNFGKNVSPNGMIEYHGNAFGGLLDHKILITRYSGGKDLAVITLNSDGDIIATDTGIDGLTHFSDPLDVAEDPQTGYLYIDELAAQRITLAKPLAGKVSSRSLHQDITPPSISK